MIKPANLATATALAFTLMSGAGVHAQEAVEVGVILPLSGSNASAGAKTMHGINAALEEINALGGVLGGRELHLIIEDTESKPQAGIEAVRKLVDVNDVPLVLGAISSAVTIPTGKYTVSKGKNQITIAATSEEQRAVGDGLFTMLATNDILGEGLAQFVAEDSKPKKVALFYMNDPFGVGMANATGEALKELGIEIIADLAYEPAKTDYRAELQRLSQASPDAVVAVSFGETARVIFKQAYELGLMEKVRGRWYQPYVANPAGRCIPEACEGIKGVDIAAEPGPRFDNFIARIQKQVGADAQLDWFTSVGYDVVWITALALNLANSDDEAAIRAAIPKAMEIYRGVTKSDFSVDADGIQVSQRFGRRVYKNGAIVDYTGD
uniref:ABC transporter substrate-binding protein n=1 Tax=Pararhizobium sp. IMCC3301 TaxID=3067904 RepID=UPI002741032F|nr:ABC transporter substrate-binding protein [Pararhizobium sp. IMCC3301]